MQIKSDNFSMDDAKRLAASPEGKELMALLKKADGTQLQNAAEQFAAGNIEDAKRALAPLLNSPQIQALLKQLGGKDRG